MADKIWGEFKLQENNPFEWALNDVCRLNAVYKERELRLLCRMKQEGQPFEELLPEESWQRWAEKGTSVTLDIKPAMPNLALIVSPENPFFLRPGATASFYVRVPLWLQLRTSKNETTLTDQPFVTLSKTWFGTPMEGELCYWKSSTALREITGEHYLAHAAICPLQLENRSSIDLHVEKICFRVYYLSLFYDGTQLWSDRMNIEYSGKESVSELTVKGQPPAEAKQAKLINGPREKLKRRIAAISFSGLLDLPGRLI